MPARASSPAPPLRYSTPPPNAASALAAAPGSPAARRLRRAGDDRSVRVRRDWRGGCGHGSRRIDLAAMASVAPCGVAKRHRLTPVLTRRSCFVANDTALAQRERVRIAVPFLVGDALQRQARVVAQPALGDRPFVGASDVVEDDHRVRRRGTARAGAAPDSARAAAAIPAGRRRRPAARAGRPASPRSRGRTTASASPARRVSCKPAWTTCDLALEPMPAHQRGGCAAHAPASCSKAIRRPADAFERIAEDERRDAGAAARRRATASGVWTSS